MQRWGENTRVKLIGGELMVKMPSQPIKRINDRANEIQARADNLRPLLDDFGDYMLERVEKRFLYEGLPRRWRPLSPAYARAKARDGFGSKGILQRTGAMRKGFRARVTPRTLQIINRRSAGGVNLFAVHQSGSRRRKIPARPMLVYGEAERNYMSGLTAFYFGFGR